MNRRVSVLMVVLFLSTLLTASASAATCRKKITSFWGYDYYGQIDCYVLVGPPIGTVLIGQIIRECDDSTWSWGRTDCTAPGAKTIDYEDCENCQSRLQVEPSEDGAQPATDSCDAVATEAAPQ